MENIILGLLLLHSRTIYELRNRIEQGMNMMFSSSMGSIQSAIKKLLEKDFIGFEESVEGGKYKKIYHITESGRQHFLSWVNSPMESQCGKFPEFAKVYFMGFAERESRRESVQRHLDFLREQYVLMEEICNSAEGMEVPDEYTEVFEYQLASAVYGKDMISFNISWFEKFLMSI